MPTRESEQSDAALLRAAIDATAGGNITRFAAISGVARTGVTRRLNGTTALTAFERRVLRVLVRRPAFARELEAAGRSPHAA